MILPPTSEGTGSSASGKLDEPESMGRLRLLACRLERRPSAVSRVIVEFGGLQGEAITAQREGSACPAGDLRLASLATLDAVSRATGGALHLELIGAKPIRAFDTNVVVVAALARRDGVVTKIIGSAIADDDILLATSRATLAAVNRLASPLLTRADAP